MVYLILTIITILVLWAYYRHHHRHRRTPTKFQQLAQPRREPTPQIRAKLIVMAGSLAEAERQVARARFADPSRSEAWYWWKAIQNLEKRN